MNIKPSIYLTSDTHFGHQSLVGWGERSESHNEDMVEAWNTVIGKHDTVLHLGDLSFVNKENTARWTHLLKGKKYLVRGNHDSASDTWFSYVGFTVLPALFETFKDKYGNSLKILFTHEPIFDLPDGWFNIHGHLHGDNHRNIITTKHHYDVGVDAHGYKPILLAKILDHFKHIHD